MPNKQPTRRQPFRRIATLRIAPTVWIVLLSVLASAATPQFFRVEGPQAFADGELDGLAVDSDGRLRLAPASRSLADAESPHVWSTAVDRSHVVFLGTGNDGKVMRIESGKAKLVFDAPELQVTALCFGPDGRLYAGTSPDGKVYVIDEAGKATTFVDPAERYIWAMGFDAKSRLWIATGGDGRLFRVDDGAKLTPVLSGPEAHVVSLAFESDGSVLAGSAPGGILYRVSPEGRASVLLDSAYRELKAIAPGPDGTVFVAAQEKGEREEAARPTPAPAQPSPTPTPAAEVTTTEAFGFALPVPQAAAPKTPEAPRASPGKGALLRVSRSGEVRVLWTSGEDAPFSLLVDGRDVIIGTGPRGKLFRVGPDERWSIVADFSGEQVTGLQRGDGEIVAATSNPGRVHGVGVKARESGSFTSKPLDATTMARWGELRFEAASAGSVTVDTRVGNTATPDATWTEWGHSVTNASGAPIAQGDARYLQLRVQLRATGGVSPVVHSVVAAYLQHNLPPEISSISVLSPGEVFQRPISPTGEAEILGAAAEEAPATRASAASRAAMPPLTAFSRRLFQKGFQTITWRADDPNEDALTYAVDYRPVAGTEWRPLRRDLADPVVAFDTALLPSGRYVIRVQASDAPSNPAADALVTREESEAFTIDNTPPSIAAKLGSGPSSTIVAEVRDDQSHVKQVEFSVDGARWETVHSKDGIDDGLSEAYEIVLPATVGAGPHVVVVRATDALDNAATASVAIPAR